MAAAAHPSFEVMVLDRGFLVIIKEPVNIGDGIISAPQSHIAYERAEGVGNALWSFLKPYTKIITTEGALPPVME